MPGSFPGLDDVEATYRDQAEALAHLWASRSTVLTQVAPLASRWTGGSPFAGLSEASFEQRSRVDAEELRAWAVLALVASFEGTVRADAKHRMRLRTKDAVRKPLARLLQADPKNAPRFFDLLGVWERGTSFGRRRTDLERLVRHRHWLAHGRHWTLKSGREPSVVEARAILDDYIAEMVRVSADFPRLS